MKLSIAATILFGITSVGCTVSEPDAASSKVESPTPIVESSPVKFPSIDPTKPNFDLAENLTYEELKDISDQVRTRCDGSKLSDLACLTLSNRELRAASIARWKADGKKWIIRDKSSPLYQK
jgi:hypothetical protein